MELQKNRSQRSKQYTTEVTQLKQQLHGSHLGPGRHHLSLGLLH